MKVAFRVDASISIGTGHFVRCLTLATALRALSAEVHFVCRYITDFMRMQLAVQGFDLSVLPPRENSNPIGLAQAPWLGANQESDARDTIAALANDTTWDWLVVDHYGLDAYWETQLKAVAKRILVIDDLADRAHNSDALLDQNLQAAGRYSDLIPKQTRLFLGPQFAILRPEFRALRENITRAGDRVRANVFFGGTDPKGMTLVALEALRQLGHASPAADVIVGIDNPKRDAIAALCSELPNTTLYIQPGNLGELFSRARLALGAAGTASWERCCLGLPTLLVSTADNQLSGSRALDQAGAALDLGPMEDVTTADLAEVAAHLLGQPERLAQMGHSAFALVDGRGAERVALFLAKDNVRLRPATIEDQEQAWIWRNTPSVRAQSFDPSPLSPESHAKWWTDSIAMHDRFLLVAHCDRLNFGILRLDRNGDTATISIYLDPQMRGLGLGHATLLAGESWLQANIPDVRRIRAEILSENKVSMGSFTAAGYRFVPSENAWIRQIYTDRRKRNHEH